MIKHEQEQSVYQLVITGLLSILEMFTSIHLRALGQITPDNTLEPENSVVNKVSEIKYLINGGAVRGENLFHSFQEFNVGENKSVYFANTSGIKNILTRVTGSNSSHILGTLGVEGEANLFLLNPKGILFGKNASLDVRGSFTATTADSIQFGKNGLFSAINPQSSNLLTVQPGALFTNAINNQQSSIQSEGNLTVGENMTLNAGNIQLSGNLKVGANLTLQALGDITTSNISAAQISLTSINGGIDTTAGTLDTSSDLVAAGDILIAAAKDIKVGKTLSISGNSGGGNIELISNNSISIEGLINSVTNLCSPENLCNRNSPTGGNIYLQSPFITVNKSGILVDIYDLGKGGNLIITTDIINVMGSGDDVDIGTRTFGMGSGGNLIVNAKEINLRNGGAFESITQGLGNAGDIVLNTNKLLIEDNQENSLFTTGISTASQTNIESIIKSVPLQSINNFEFTNDDFKTGKGGNIIINASESIQIIGNLKEPTSFELNLQAVESLFDIDAGISTGTLTTGKAGTLTINTKQLTTQNGAGIFTGSIAPKFIPNVFPNDIPLEVNNLFNQLDSSTKSTLALSGITPASVISNIYFQLSNFSDAGDGGNLEVNANQVTLQGLGGLTTLTLSSGNAGNLLTQTKQISLKNGSIVGVSSLGSGNAGTLNMKTNQLTIKNGAKVIAGNIDQGFGGNINITASKLVEIIGTSFDGTNSSSIVALAENNSLGNAGNIHLNTPNLIIRNGARIEAQTKGAGTAGNIVINNANFIDISGVNKFAINSGLVSSSENYNSGNGGTIIINQGNPQGILNLSDGGFLSVITRSSNNGGKIDINMNSLNIESGGKIISTATTRSSGNAGNINVQVIDNISLQGKDTGLFANTEIGSTGNSGSIEIDPKTFIIKNGAGIGVNNQGTGKGGNISLQAGTLSLDNQGFITAETASNQGGEINLNLQDLLLLQNNSRITATAGTNGTGGDGGNININSPFVVAFNNENIDITANAFEGNGGKINILTNAIFGLEFRPQLTPRNDITASSQFGLAGEVQINTPEVDPTSGLIELTGSLVDAESLVGKDICSAEQLAKGSSFTIIGRGGLPAKADELISNSPAILEWLTRSNYQKNKPIIIKKLPINHKQENIQNPAIQQAQGWIIKPDGKVILTAQVPNVNPQDSGLNHPNCQLKFPSALMNQSFNE